MDTVLTPFSGPGFFSSREFDPLAALNLEVNIMPAWRDPQDDEIRSFHDYIDVTDQRVLEIGIGEGRLAWRYASAAHRVTGIDPTHERIKVAVQDRPAGLPVDLTMARAQALPFPRETFDRAILAWSL